MFDGAKPALSHEADSCAGSRQQGAYGSGGGAAPERPMFFRIGSALFQQSFGGLGNVMDSVPTYNETAPARILIGCNRIRLTAAERCGYNF